ncbi:MAG: type II toxin-antitoxin system RelE/ParE family toxin [Bacteroidota bacterium]
MSKIVWSDLAYLSYTDISDYISENYSLDKAIQFDETVEKLLENLRIFNHFCPVYQPRPQLRKCTINKYSSLLYRIDGNTIQLISFFDNRGIHPF